MINRKKVVALSFLTALITTLMFANLNSTSIVVADPGTSSTTMTFNSNVTMQFEIGNVSWISSGKYMRGDNATHKNQDVTHLKPGTELQADVRPGWDFDPPTPGSWWYVYGTLYGMYIAFKVDQVWGSPGSPYFNISETWDHWYRTPRNFTFDETPVEFVDCERMMSNITTGVDYVAWVDHWNYPVPPRNDSWWTIVYMDCVFGNSFHINHVEFWYTELGEDNYIVRFDEVRNTTGDVVPEILVPPAPDGFCPIEGIEGIQRIATIEPTEYRISSPACLLPEDSWWKITYPDELSETQFHIDFSEQKSFLGAFHSHMHIDDIVGSAVITPPGVEYIEAVWANAPNVATIGSCGWYKVIEGLTPPKSTTEYPISTCWNITAPEAVKGVTFSIDIACESVFHIDEVLPEDQTGLNLATVTAEKFTPEIYIEPATEIYHGCNYTISIKTDYIFHIWSYDFSLTYDPAVLAGIGVTNGDLIPTGAGVSWWPGMFDNVNGELSRTGAKFDYTTPPAPQTHGPGTLATVTFQAVGVGTSDITFDDDETKLTGVTDDGYGEKYSIEYPIRTGQIIDSQVTVKVVGDVNGDGDVDRYDFGDFGMAYGSEPGDDNWDERCDFDCDGDVDRYDFGDFGMNYGYPW